MLKKEKKKEESSKLLFINDLLILIQSILYSFFQMVLLIASYESAIYNGLLDSSSDRVHEFLWIYGRDYIFLLFASITLLVLNHQFNKKKEHDLQNIIFIFEVIVIYYLALRTILMFII